MDQDIAAVKKRLRAEMRAELASLSPKQISDLSARVMLNIETGLRDRFHQTLGVLFLPLPTEVSPMELVTHFKEVAFVRVESNRPPRLSLRQCDPYINQQLETLEAPGVKVRQPKETCPIVHPDEASTVVIVPGLAFTRDGYRLGRGGGFYDSLLAQMPGAFRLGIAFDQQIVSELPLEMHDLGLDAVATDKQWILTGMRK